MDLVTRAQNGDHEAFASLATAAYPRLFRIARLMLRDTEVAQDAVQDALVLAWRHLAALRDAGAWDSWLHRLTVRACYRHSNSARRRRVTEVGLGAGGEERAAGDQLGPIVERDRLDRALDRVPLDQRAVLVLHFYLDLPMPEVAALLEVPLGTAKSRLHRGLEALRRTLGHEVSAGRGAEGVA